MQQRHAIDTPAMRRAAEQYLQAEGHRLPAIDEVAYTRRVRDASSGSREMAVFHQYWGGAAAASAYPDRAGNFIPLCNSMAHHFALDGIGVSEATVPLFELSVRQWVDDVLGTRYEAVVACWVGEVYAHLGRVEEAKAWLLRAVRTGHRHDSGTRDAIGELLDLAVDDPIGEAFNGGPDGGAV